MTKKCKSRDLPDSGEWDGGTKIKSEVTVGDAHLLLERAGFG